MIFETIAIAFSTYSRLPMPQVPWNEKNKRFVLAAFPLVGALIGAVAVLLVLLCDYLALPAGVLALLVPAVPLLLTGGIHADGFIDTADARHSYAAREKKLEILKDPHVGAFGVIRLILYVLLVLAALWTALSTEQHALLLPPLFFSFLLSRALSGLAGEVFPKAKADGILAGFAGEKNGKAPAIVLLLETIAVAVLFILLSPYYAVQIVLLNLLLLLYYYRMSMREFGGVTGDLAGWFLCLSELLSAGTAAVTAVVRGVLL